MKIEFLLSETLLMSSPSPQTSLPEEPDKHKKYYYDTINKQYNVVNETIIDTIKDKIIRLLFWKLGKKK